MAVLISNGNTTLNTTNGFYRVEAHNLGGFATSFLSLNVERTIPVQFANAGDCQGIVLALLSNLGSNLLSTFRDVQVELQENSSGWVTRATKVLTVGEITHNSTKVSYNISYVIPFEFDTPYAVDTASGKWRFRVISVGGNAIDFQLRTSNGSSPMYATWCDNAVSFNDNDAVICKDIVRIDRNATVKGVLGTGDTTRAVAFLVCRAIDPTHPHCYNLRWEENPASSYTLNIDGNLVISAYGGWQIGTAENPIPLTSQAKVDFIVPTIGTIRGVTDYRINTTNINAYYQSVSFYGEVASNRYDRLASNANTGQPNIVTENSTGWTAGDRLVIMKDNSAFITPQIDNTISSISGTNITMTNNLTGAMKNAGGHVVNLDRYGIFIKSTTNNLQWLTSGFNNLKIVGVCFENIIIRHSLNPVQLRDDDAGRQTLQEIKHSCFYQGNPASVTEYINSICIPVLDLNIDDNIFISGNMTINIGYSSAGWAGFGSRSGTLRIRDNVVYRVTSQTLNFTGLRNQFLRNTFYCTAGNVTQGVVSYGSTFSGLFQPQIKDNYYWFCATGVYIGQLINPDWSGDTFNGSADCILFHPSACVAIGKSLSFGQESVNTFVLRPLNNNYADFELESPIGNVNVRQEALGTTVLGTQYKISSNNQTPNNDLGFFTFGRWQKTGAELSDKTERTSGGYAMRIEPLDSVELAEYPALRPLKNIPVGNIQNKTMTITVWVYINSDNYWAGTHQMPRMHIEYDNQTEIYAEAVQTAGAWQQIALTFTPTTTYGQILLWFTSATDATTSNAYWYIDDINVGYPAGVNIDLGGIDLWANGLPVFPPIATNPSLAGVWDEPLSAHTIPNTYGTLVKDIDVKADDNTALSL